VTFHVFLLLLLLVLMFALSRLCSLYWSHHCPSQSAAVAKSTPIQRLLRSRSPDDCPLCRLSCTPSSLVEPAPPAMRPWREVKSRRGAPKRVNTEGFACPCAGYLVVRSEKKLMRGECLLPLMNCVECGEKEKRRSNETEPEESTESQSSRVRRGVRRRKGNGHLMLSYLDWYRTNETLDSKRRHA
jgi:hypothetical protein